jgi:hypothetical protein
MPTLKAQANLLTNPSLQSGIIEVLIDRGARELMAVLPFKSFSGSTYDFNLEEEIGTGNSAQDPYGVNNIPNAGGKNRRVAVPSIMMIRNADVPEIDVVGKSDVNDIRADKIEKQAKKLAKDFLFQFINARVDETETYASYNMRGLEHWLDKYLALGFTEQAKYNTNTGLVGGTRQNLSLNSLDDLISRYKDEQFDVLYTDRETFVYIKGLLNAAGGNTAAMLMNEKFGMSMLHYDGVPIAVVDAVGASKTWASATIAGTTITVTDPAFLGFSSLDVGRSITQIGGTSTIATVVNTHQVTVAVATGMGAGAGSVAKTSALYAVRFGELDAVSAVFHEGRGVPARAGDYYGPIAGFDAVDMDMLEDSPRLRTRITWYGNTVVQSPYAIARLSHYLLG